MALAALLAALAATPRPASAEMLAYSVPGTTNVRAGPGTQYPVVARVRGGLEIIVFGCLSDREWCDIQVYDVRGWMSARRLQFAYAGNYVPVQDYWGYFGAPIISFNFGYWDNYYFDRPWYRKWRRHNRPQHQWAEPDVVQNWPGPQGPVDRPPVYQDPGPGFDPGAGAFPGPGIVEAPSGNPGVMPDAGEPVGTMMCPPGAQYCPR